MEKPTQALTVAQPQALATEDLLSSKELIAYDRYKKEGGHPLSPTVHAQFFALYLNGKTPDEIQTLNPGYPLGAIIKALVEGRWIERKREHLDNLLEGARGRVEQVQLESIVFVSDLLSAANKMHGDKIKKYLQTGNATELGDLKIDSLGAYTRAVDLLMKLTQQDGESKVKHTHTIMPPVGGQVANATIIDAQIIESPKTGTEAVSIMKALSNFGKKE